MCFHGQHFRIFSVSAFAVSLFPCCRFVSLSVSSSFCVRVLPASLSRALVDSPVLHTDTKDCTLRAVGPLAPTLPLFPPHVYHRQGTGQSRTSMWPPQTSQVDAGATPASRGNRKSQRPCVPPLAFPNRSFFAPCSLWCSHCVPTVPWLCCCPPC